MEVMVAVMLVGVCLVPALEALQGGVQSSSGYEEQVNDLHALRGRLESLSVEPFSILDVEAQATALGVASTNYSDLPGTENRILVYLQRYDGDNADLDDDPTTGVDAGLLLLRVAGTTSGQTLETLLSQ